MRTDGAYALVRPDVMVGLEKELPVEKSLGGLCFAGIPFEKRELGDVRWIIRAGDGTMFVSRSPGQILKLPPPPTPNFDFIPMGVEPEKLFRVYAPVSFPKVRIPLSMLYGMDIGVDARPARRRRRKRPSKGMRKHIRREKARRRRGGTAG